MRSRFVVEVEALSRGGAVELRVLVRDERHGFVIGSSSTAIPPADAREIGPFAYRVGEVVRRAFEEAARDEVRHA